MRSLEQVDPAVLANGSRTLWVIIAAMAAAVVLGYWATGLAVDVLSNTALLGSFPVLGSIVWVYRSVRPDEHLASAMETATQLLLVLLFGIVLSYAAAAVALPYRDAELYAIDQWLGFDRRAYLDFVARQELGTACGIIYLTMQPQLALVPLALVLARQPAHLQQFVVAFAIALVVTIAVFVFVPAVGAFVHADLTPEAYARLPATVYTPARTLDALRSGLLQSVSLNDLEGLIAFPSFHTAAGLLYVWALWPIRLLRWPAAIVNCAMIATTPLGGAHYVIDLLAGAVVAVVAMSAARRLCGDERSVRPARQCRSAGAASPSPFRARPFSKA